MTKEEAIAFIDERKNKIIDPVVMLNYAWLRLIILNININHWNAALGKAEDTLRK